MNKAEITAAVRGLIDDQDGAFCSAAEMDFHLAEVSQDFCKRARVMRKSQAVGYLTTGLIALPDGCGEIIRITDAAGEQICPTSLAHMEALYGSAWQTQTGTPDYYTRDLTGPGEIRLSHIPSTAGAVTIDYLAVSRDEQQVHWTYHGTLVWGVAARAMAKSGNPMDQTKTAQFSAAYEAGLVEAASEASSSFAGNARQTPYRHI